MIKDQDIICVAPNQWDDIWRRRHQLMSRFARDNKVLFLEPANFLLFALFSRRGLSRLLKGKFYFHRLEPNFSILSQYLVLPFEVWCLQKGFTWVKRVNDWFNLKMLKRILNRLDFDKPILWVYYTPRSGSFIGKCAERLVVCDVFDRYSAYLYYADHPWLQKHTDTLESDLITKADLVFASSAPLFDYCQKLNSNVHLIPNGADTSLLDLERTVPKVPIDAPRPIIGYVGAIFGKLDFELLVYLATERPDWTILMIGPSSFFSESGSRTISTLREMDNVVFLGSKPRDELPGYYEAIDVALIPYILDEATEYMFPLKIFEYMAFKKPIVSTDIPAVREFSDVISIAKTRGQFIDSIATLLSSDNSQRLQQGFETAQKNSWENRVEEMAQIIGSHLES